MSETQYTINAWQEATFPEATSEGIINHLKEEFQEFLDAKNLIETGIEAADLVILIYAWAGLNNINFQSLIDAKMRINRSRSWNIQPDGTGRHT